MFRRIELIYWHTCKRKFCSRKGGIFSCLPCYRAPVSYHNSWEEIFESWAIDTKIKGNCGNIPRNAKFFFTERGWEEIGKKIVNICLKTKTKFRILKVKENSVNVVWNNGYELAAQPKKEKQ